MPRRKFGQETFHMDHLRSSPSQQHLDPNSRSSSLSQQDHDDIEREVSANAPADLVGITNAGPGGELDGQRPHKLDLYSIPVFLLECLILGALGYAAYFVHFKHKLEPLLSGFYCDDISLRQTFSETQFTEQFIQPDNELILIVMLAVVPIVIVIFCELVNSMFGSLKFRQIRSLCKCCKLHSITRRTLRFSGAYLLGFLVVMISCDILARNAGNFHPYFAQECPTIYNECLKSSQPLAAELQSSSSSRALDLESLEREKDSSPKKLDTNASNLDSATRPGERIRDSSEPTLPLSPPISNASDLTATTNIQQAIVPASEANSKSASQPAEYALRRTRRDTITQINKSIIERKWIDLTNSNLKQLCQFSGDEIQSRKFDLIAMSWPSFPSAIFSYACFYLACYLSFIGTARPFRLITIVIIMILLLIATSFNVQLVKEHYNHWEDVAGGAGLSFLVVLFVLTVYLNKFRDTHYYENQKLYGSASKMQQQLRQALMMVPGGHKIGYSNEAGQYQLDKFDGGHVGGNASAPAVQNHNNGTGAVGGSNSNNDLAMRYFQIPRANYRGAPRPWSSINRA